MNFGLVELSYLAQRTAQQSDRRRIRVQNHPRWGVGNKQGVPGRLKNRAVVASVFNQIRRSLMQEGSWNPKRARTVKMILTHSHISA
jgi:hypothetical protein